MKRFDPSVPRQMFWSNNVGGKSHCPRCFSILENEHHVYMMAIRDADGIYPYIVGNDAGYFCPQCPSIVIDRDTFAEFAQFSISRENDAVFTVLGLVDLEAVPKDKRSLPFDDDNPVPLVQFSNMSERKTKRRNAASQRKKKKKHVKRNKKRR